MQKDFKLVTADDILIKNNVLQWKIEEDKPFNINLSRDGYKATTDNILQAMLEFAQYHVKLALEAAANKAKVKFVEDETDILNGGHKTVDKDSITNSYPLENIK